MKSADIHPELQDDEIYMGNVPRNDVEGEIQPSAKSYNSADFRQEGRNRWKTMTWKTKRAGNTAYYTDGKVSPDAVPVFIKTQEVLDYIEVEKGKGDPMKLVETLTQMIQRRKTL